MDHVCVRHEIRWIQNNITTSLIKPKIFMTNTHIILDYTSSQEHIENYYEHFSRDYCYIIYFFHDGYCYYLPDSNTIENSTQEIINAEINLTREGNDKSYCGEKLITELRTPDKLKELTIVRHVDAAEADFLANKYQAYISLCYNNIFKKKYNSCLRFNNQFNSVQFNKDSYETKDLQDKSSCGEKFITEFGATDRVKEGTIVRHIYPAEGDFLANKHQAHISLFYNSIFKKYNSCLRFKNQPNSVQHNKDIYETKEINYLQDKSSCSEKLLTELRATDRIKDGMIMRHIYAAEGHFLGNKYQSQISYCSNNISREYNYRLRFDSQGNSTQFNKDIEPKKINDLQENVGRLTTHPFNYDNRMNSNFIYSISNRNTLYCIDVYVSILQVVCLNNYIEDKNTIVSSSVPDVILSSSIIFCPKWFKNTCNAQNGITLAADTFKQNDYNGVRNIIKLQQPKLKLRNNLRSSFTITMPRQITNLHKTTDPYSISNIMDIIIKIYRCICYTPISGTNITSPHVGIWYFRNCNQGYLLSTLLKTTLKGSTIFILRDVYFVLIETVNNNVRLKINMTKYKVVTVYEKMIPEVFKFVKWNEDHRSILQTRGDTGLFVRNTFKEYRYEALPVMRYIESSPNKSLIKAILAYNMSRNIAFRNATLAKLNNNTDNIKQATLAICNDEISAQCKQPSSLWQDSLPYFNETILWLADICHKSLTLPSNLSINNLFVNSPLDEIIFDATPVDMYTTYYKQLFTNTMFNRGFLKTLGKSLLSVLFSL